MSENETVQFVLSALLTRRSMEFRAGGETYLIQPDNNKGCDYLSLWRTGPRPARLGQVMYDVMYGVDDDAVSELLRLPCVRGESILQRIQSGAVEWL